MFSSIAVYCGSSAGHDPHYQQAAEQVGAELAALGTHIIYGGGSVGLMGAVANGALSKHGKITGVITEQLQDLELGHPGLTQMEIVPNMEARKLRMAELASAFLILPGGPGTLDEMFEAAVRTQLHLDPKPVGILNLKDYYTPMLQQWEHMITEGFVLESHRKLLHHGKDLNQLLQDMQTFAMPPLDKWVKPER